MAGLRDWFARWTVFIAAGIAVVVLGAGGLSAVSLIRNAPREVTCEDRGRLAVDDLTRARENLAIARGTLDRGFYIDDAHRDETLEALQSLVLDLEEVEASLTDSIATIESWYESSDRCLRR